MYDCHCANDHYERSNWLCLTCVCHHHHHRHHCDAITAQCFVITYTPATVEVGLPPAQARTKRAYDARLRELLPREKVRVPRTRDTHARTHTLTD